MNCTEIRNRIRFNDEIQVKKLKCFSMVFQEKKDKVMCRLPVPWLFYWSEVFFELCSLFAIAMAKAMSSIETLLASKVSFSSTGLRPST